MMPVLSLVVISPGGAVAPSSEVRRDLGFPFLLLVLECEKRLDETPRRNEGDRDGRGVRSQKVSGTKRKSRPRLKPTIIETILRKHRGKLLPSDYFRARDLPEYPSPIHRRYDDRTDQRNQILPTK